MEIHLGLNFNDGLAIPARSRLGSIYQNYAGFFSILNTQLGLAVTDVSTNKRILQYLECLEVQGSSFSFYAQSLSVSPLAVAKKLLSWRDNLYLAGWDGSFSGEGSTLRLTDLASVEQVAQKKVANNEGQNLQSIIVALKKYHTQITKIHLYDDLQILPAQWQNVISCLEATGVEVIKSKALSCDEVGKSDLHLLQQHLCFFNQQKVGRKIDKLTLAGDGSVLVIQSQSKMSSAELLSKYLAKEQNIVASVVIAESNEEIIDQYIAKQNLPRQGASLSSSSRSILQLLPLSLQLMWRPLDIDKVLSFLVHPINMIPGFACRILAKIISSCPGIGGEAWQEGIQLIKRQAKEIGCSDKEIDNIVIQIDEWLCHSNYYSEEGVPVATVQNKVSKVVKYLQGHVSYILRQLSEEKISSPERQSLEAEQSLVHMALNHCTQFSELLDVLTENGEENISQLKLNQLLKWVMKEGASTPLIRKEANGPLLSNHCAQVIQPIDQLIWWDISANNGRHHTPWSPSEIEFLTSQNLSFVDPQQQLAQQEYYALQALFNVKKQLILVIHSGSENHFLWDQICTISEGVATICLEDVLLYEKNKEFSYLNVKILPQSPQLLPVKKRWWDLGSGKYLCKRDVESYSSLDAFINSPYQWVLNYKARLRSGSLLSVSEGNQLKGTMTHHLFEIFFTQHALKWSVLTTAAIKDWFDDQFDQLITYEAATFLMLGKKSELEQFKQTVYQALSQLIDHLKLAKIKNIKMEDRNEAPFFAGKMMGDIDMLLMNQRGDEIVLDIKWGWEKGRAESLEKNLHTQLVLYSYLRRKQTNAKLWPEQAYFIIQTGNLLAQNNFTFADAKVYAPDEGDNAATLWKKLECSYHWRREQLDNGKIEMTVRGTLPNDDSLPPDDALSIKKENDHFNDFKTLMGWEV
jgi:ATP-dependent helicase/nuclease subunit B